MDVQRIRIDQINVGHRFRKEYGDIKGLAEKIKRDHKGKLLQPIIVSKLERGYKLHAGARRLKAMRENGESHIPAVVIDVGSELHALLIERDENERLEMTPGEKAELGKAIEQAIGNRQGQRNPKQLPENFPEVNGKETRELAAEAAGFGNSRTFAQAKQVNETGCRELIKLMNDDGISVSDAAFVAKQDKQTQRAAVRRLGAGEYKTGKAAVEAIIEEKAMAADTTTYLPRSVKNALADTWHADCARTLAAMRQQCASAFSWSSWLDGAVVSHLKIAEEFFKAAIPRAVCPECEGQKVVDGESCRNCRGGGYMGAQV